MTRTTPLEERDISRFGMFDEETFRELADRSGDDVECQVLECNDVATLRILCRSCRALQATICRPCWALFRFDGRHKRYHCVACDVIVHGADTAAEAVPL